MALQLAEPRSQGFSVAPMSSSACGCWSSNPEVRHGRDRPEVVAVRRRCLAHANPPRARRRHNTICRVDLEQRLRPICTWRAKGKGPWNRESYAARTLAASIQIRENTNPWIREHAGTAVPRRRWVRCRRSRALLREFSERPPLHQPRTLKPLVLDGSVIPKVAHFRHVTLAT